MDTEGEGEPLNPNEIELVFKPHPIEMTGDNQLMRALRDSSVRYLKTTANASGRDLIKAGQIIFFHPYFFFIQTVSCLYQRSIFLPSVCNTT